MRSLLLSADLLRRVLPQLRLPAGVTGALGAADMSQIAPAQYLADMVVVLSDQQTGKPVLAVVIEPQGRDRRTKKVSWLVYLTTAIKANKVPRAILMVILAGATKAIDLATPGGRDAVLTAIEQAGASHADTAAFQRLSSE